MNFWPFNRPKKPEARGGRKVRSFAAAGRSRYTDWLTATFSKINWDLRADLRDLVVKSRDLSKNNAIFRSHLNNVQNAVLGKSGFQLQCLAKGKDGEIDRALSDEVEWQWYQFQRARNGFLTTDGHTGGRDLDALVLRSILIDGQAFIRIVKDQASPYGVRFRLLDALTVDTLKNQRFSAGQNAIVCGVQIDQLQRPIAYWIRPGDELLYQTRQLQRVPAEQIIHLYKKEFPGQVRGFPSICAAVNSLKQLDDYKLAELYAAKLNACVNVFYQRNQNPTAGGFLGQADDDPGAFIQQMSPGEASIVPDGYTVKNPTNNHPNVNFGGFVKQICRQIGSSVGVSYNRLLHDYSDVNYSSLRQATIDQTIVWQRWQQYLIENWKQVEFRIWLAAAVLAGDWLKPGDVQAVMRGAAFICSKRQWFDPAKDVAAVEKEIAMGTKNPLQVIDQNGEDPDDVLDGWDRWRAMCQQRGLSFSAKPDAPGDEINEDISSEGTGGADGGGADGAASGDLA